MATVNPIGNNIRIIDPNPENKNVNLEDLFVYVKLLARTKSRSILTKEEDETTTIAEQTINVRNETNYTYPTGRDGEVKPLNTDWTKIGGGTLFGGEDVGGFGITNIDVEFKSSFMPKIVIDFVDIRGATLFEQGPCSPYASFFHLPYPVFELTVKGYYGKPVKYQLALVKFNTKFNAETGNFESRGEFVGYTYAFLADIPMGYVIAAGNMPNAEGILVKKYKKTLNRLKEEDERLYNERNSNDTEDDNLTRVGGVILDTDGIPTGLPEVDNCIENDGETGVKTTCGPISMYELLKKIKELEKINNTVASSTELEQLQNLSKAAGELKRLVTTVNDSIRDLQGIGFAPRNSEVKITSIKGIISNTRLTKPTLIIESTADSSETNTKLNSAQETIKSYYGLTEEDFDVSKFGLLISIYNNLVDEKNLDPSIKLNLTFNNLVNNSNGVGGLGTPIQSNQSGNVSTKEYSVDFGLAFLSQISQSLVKIDDVLKEEKKKLTSAVNRLVFDALGFKPTIRNVFAVMLCNVEVFLELLLQSSNKAEQKHDENDDISLFGNGDSGGNITDVNIGKVYPWPTYFEKRVTNNGGVGDKEIYPGERLEFFDWEEVIFVESFIKALADLKEQLDQLKGEVENKPGFDNFIPLTPYETHFFGNNETPNRWYRTTDLSGSDEVAKVMAESAFLIGDYSFLNKLTAWKSQLGYDNDWLPGNPKPKFEDVAKLNQTELGRGQKTLAKSLLLSWGIPWVNGDKSKSKLTTMTNLDLMKKAGRVDALNFLSTIKSPNLLLEMLTLSKQEGSTATILQKIKEQLGDTLKEETFNDWASRVTSGNPNLVNNQNGLWNYVGSNKQNGNETNSDWVYHKEDTILTHQNKISASGYAISGNPHRNEEMGIKFYNGTQVNTELIAIDSRDINLDKTSIEKTRGAQLYKGFQEYGYGENTNNINQSMFGIPDSVTFNKTKSRNTVKPQEKSGLPTVEIKVNDTETSSRSLFVKEDEINGENPFTTSPSDDIQYGMGGVSRMEGYGGLVSSSFGADWDFTQFSNLQYSPLVYSRYESRSGVSEYDPLIQTPIWVHNYPFGKRNISPIPNTDDDGIVDENTELSTKTFLGGLNNHPSAQKFYPLAYIWLLSHGHYENDSGYHFFHDYELSPANAFNFSPVSVKIPKGYALLMGATFWRLKESGQLAGEGITPTTFNGGWSQNTSFDKNDPVWFDFSTLNTSFPNVENDNPILKWQNCNPNEIPISYYGFTSNAIDNAVKGAVFGGLIGSITNVVAGGETAQPSATNALPKHLVLVNTGDKPMEYYQPRLHAKEFMYLPTRFKERLISYFENWVENKFPSLLQTIDPLNFDGTSNSVNTLTDNIGKSEAYEKFFEYYTLDD
jgi:hypothetical protein